MAAETEKLSDLQTKTVTVWAREKECWNSSATIPCLHNTCRSPGLEAFVTAQRRPWSSWPMDFVVARCPATPSMVIMWPHQSLAVVNNSPHTQCCIFLHLPHWVSQWVTYMNLLKWFSQHGKHCQIGPCQRGILCNFRIGSLKVKDLKSSGRNLLFPTQR